MPNDTPTSALRLRTLGPTPRLVEVSDHGEESLVFGPGKPLAVLIYLSLAPGATASRGHLTDLLWADSDLERARQSLRQAIWQIRRKLGDASIVGDGEQLTLRVPIASDFAEVGNALRTAEFEETVRLYAGDFLSEFAVPGGAGFEHWADKVRDRIRGGWMRALDALARERLNRGAHREAVILARRLRDADPDNEAVWRFLLEALLLAGDAIGAGTEADALEALLAEERREPEPQTLPFIARVRATPIAAGGSTAGILSTELIGREGEFRRITQAWERVRIGQSLHLHLSAPAGLGKTRLLRDAERRLRAMGGRILYLRAPPGSRQIAYAFAAELARALVALPGASGVTPTALATLQALDPSLVTGFDGPPDVSTGAEALRRRTLALADLLQALGEESPLALLVDDVHWMDGDSLQLLAGLCSREAGSAVLVVTAGRPARRQELLEADAEVITLAPLTVAEVEALIMSAGALPAEAEWPTLLVHRLHAASRGSPYLVLESLQLVLDRGWLALGEPGWSCADPDGLARELPEGDALRRRVELLPAQSRLLLALLATAAAPLRARVLAAAAGLPEEEVALLLGALELGGFVAGAEDRWRLGHDELAEVALRGSGPDGERDFARRLGTALLVEPSISPFDHQRAAELLIQGGAEESLAPLFRRWLAAAHRRQDPRGDADLARALLGSAATRERLRRVLRLRPMSRRLGLDTQAKRWGAAGAGFMMLAAVALFASRSATRPVRMELLQAPIAGNSAALVPVPVIEIQDGSGRRVRDAETEVRLEVVGDSAHLLGTKTAVAVEGLATFDRAALSPDAPEGSTLLFSADGMPPITVTLGSPAGPTLRLDRARLNGQEITAEHQTLTIAPGEEIRGEVVLRYSAYWAAASVILGAFPSWGDKRGSFITLSALATPVVDAATRHTVAIAGPDRPGDYHLILAFAAETDARWIASGTNWAAGAPIWDDGNDLADLSAGEVSLAESRGQLHRDWFFESAHGFLPQVLATTVIEVRVR